MYVLDATTFCEDTQQRASYEGTIVSPTVDESRIINCTLELTDIPQHTWFELAVVSADLYDNCHVHDKKHYNFVKIVGETSNECEEGEEIRLYKVNARSITVWFYSTSFASYQKFVLRYRGTYM